MKRVRVKLFRIDDPNGYEVLQTQINTFLSTKQADDVIEVSVTPIYTTISENNILQGFFGVVVFKQVST